MEPKPGTIARALVDLLNALGAAIKGVGGELADWSGFSADDCVMVVFPLTLVLFVITWGATWKAFEAACDICQRLAKRFVRRWRRR